MDNKTLISMYYNFANATSEGKWKNQLDFLKLLNERDDLYLTLMSPYETGTFAADNKQFLLSFVNQQFKNFQANDEPLDKLFFSIVIRQFTNIKHSSKIPQKRLAMCLVTSNGVVPISKEDNILASTTNASNGTKLAPEKGVTYISFDDMLGYLNIGT